MVTVDLANINAFGFVKDIKNELDTLTDEYNTLETELANLYKLPTKGTFLMAITSVLPIEYRYGCGGSTKPFIIMVRDGEYVLDIHSAHFTKSDIRVNNRCCYYNDKLYNKYNKYTWSDLVHTYTGDNYDYLHPEMTGNYSYHITASWLHDRIQHMKALIAMQHQVKIIELRDDSIIYLTKHKKDIVLNETKTIYHGYVNYDFAWTKPTTDTIPVPVGYIDETTGKRIYPLIKVLSVA